MKNVGILFLISFLFYLIGHIFWFCTIICETTLFSDKQAEIWIISIPFFLFAIFGVLGSIKLYQLYK